MNTGEEKHPLDWFFQVLNSDPFTLHNQHPPLTAILRTQHSSDCDKSGLRKSQVLCLAKAISLLGCHKAHVTSKVLSSPGSTIGVFFAFIQVYSCRLHITNDMKFSKCSFSQQNFLKDLLEKANKTVDDTKLAEYTDLMVSLNWKRLSQELIKHIVCVLAKSQDGINKSSLHITYYRWAFLIKLHHIYLSQRLFFKSQSNCIAKLYSFYMLYIEYKWHHPSLREILNLLLTIV